MHINRDIHTTPVVTVLMSCFNAERWVAESIESVLSQTFEDFELLLINDGSLDNTDKIINFYARCDPRIKIITKENTGLTDSLNVGIFQAQGQWIARLDADDLCETTRLAEQLRYLKNNQNVVLLGSGCREVNISGKVIKSHQYPCSNINLLKNLRRCKRFFPHSSAVYSTSLVRSLGGYRTRIRRAQDWDLWLRLSEFGNMACLNKPLVRIRKHDEQISEGESGKLQLVDCFIGIVSHFLRSEGTIDPVSVKNDEEWMFFYDWVRKKVEESGLLQRKRSWNATRTIFTQSENKFLGALLCGAELYRSGSVPILIKERCFGISLPASLAREWESQ